MCNGSKVQSCLCAQSLSHVQLFVIPQYCHFLLQVLKWGGNKQKLHSKQVGWLEGVHLVSPNSELLLHAYVLRHSVRSSSLWPYGPWPTRLLCPWDSPGKNTGIDCHFLLQGIFPTWRLNLGFLYCRQDLYHLNQLKEFFFIRLWKSNWDFRPWNLNITRLKHIFINQNKNHYNKTHFYQWVISLFVIVA